MAFGGQVYQVVTRRPLGMLALALRIYEAEIHESHRAFNLGNLGFHAKFLSEKNRLVKLEIHGRENPALVFLDITRALRGYAA